MSRFLIILSLVGAVLVAVSCESRANGAGDAAGSSVEAEQVGATEDPTGLSDVQREQFKLLVARYRAEAYEYIAAGGVQCVPAGRAGDPDWFDLCEQIYDGHLNAAERLAEQAAVVSNGLQEGDCRTALEALARRVSKARDDVADINGMGANGHIEQMWRMVRRAHHAVILSERAIANYRTSCQR